MLKKCNQDEIIIPHEKVRERIIYRPIEKIIVDTVKIVKIIKDTITISGNISTIDSTDTSKTFSLTNEINLYDSLVYLKTENSILLKKNNLTLLSSRAYDIQFNIPLTVQLKERPFNYEITIKSEKKDFTLIDYKRKYRKSNFLYFFTGITYNTQGEILPAIGVGFSVPLFNLDFITKKKKN